MNYVGSTYRLEALTAESYRSEAKKFANLQNVSGLEGALRTITKKDEPLLAHMISSNADLLHSTYGHGGGRYALAFGMGLSALRGVKPSEALPKVEPEDWHNMMERERELRSRPDLHLVEQIGGVGLLKY